MDDSLPALGDLEREVMQLVWANGPVTAEAVRERLSRPLKESTVRTVLRRLEDKGYTTHTVDGRTYVYHAAEPRGRVAAKAVQRIVDWFCNGFGRRGVGRHGGYSYARPTAVAYACRPSCEGKGEGREKMMLAILAESALRSLLLGSAVWVGFESSSCTKSTRAYDMLGNGAGGVVVDAASDALDHGDHHPGPVAGADSRKTVARQSPFKGPLPELLRSPPPSELGMPVAAHGENYEGRQLAGHRTAIYAFVAGDAVAEIGGRHLSDMASGPAAKPVREPWAANSNVRVSKRHRRARHLGSTILLPPQWVDWDLPKRQAVLAHEGAHVANRDFHVLLLASLNRACSGSALFRGGQLIRLAELAEIISDARALEVFEDRLSYAEILLDLVQNVRRAPAGFGNGESVYGPRTRRAHSCRNRNRSPGQGRLAEAALDNSSRAAGCHRFRRHHRLQQAAGVHAGD